MTIGASDPEHRRSSNLQLDREEPPDDLRSFPPARQCAACAHDRSARPPARPARPREPGSSTRQRLHNRRRQLRRDRARYPHHNLPGKLHLDRRSATKPPTFHAVRRGVVRCGDQKWCKPRNRSPQLLAPAIDLARRDVGPTSNLGNDCARREAFGDDRPLLLLAPATPALNAADNLNSRYRTVASTSASTVICTGAKPCGHHPARRPSPAFNYP